MTTLEQLNAEREFHLKRLADVDTAIAVIQSLDAALDAATAKPVEAKPVEPETGTVLDNILKLMGGHYAPMTVDQIAYELGYSHSSIRNVVYRGVKEGKIDRVHHGLFALAKVKPSVAEVVSKTKTASEKIAEQLGMIPPQVEAEEQY